MDNLLSSKLAFNILKIKKTFIVITIIILRKYSIIISSYTFAPQFRESISLEGKVVIQTI